MPKPECHPIVQGVIIWMLVFHLPLHVVSDSSRKSDFPAKTIDQIGDLKFADAAVSRHSRELTKLISKKCTCGVNQPVPTKKFRIVGGADAKPHSRPWMVALVTKRNFHFCGGGLINNQYVLTAAHCVYRQRPSRLFAVLGLHDKMNAEQIQAGRRSIAEILKHPDYEKSSSDNDIALLRLSDLVEISSTISPLCLPQVDANFAGYSGTVSGWGAVADKSPVGSDTLKEVALPVLSLEDCKNKYPGEVTDNMMCAGYEHGEKDACQGDSGGPMIIQEHGRWYFIGVVSWGEGCALANFPGIYTNVSRYVYWIYSNTQGAVYCW